jgi:hypothetical protein
MVFFWQTPEPPPRGFLGLAVPGHWSFEETLHKRPLGQRPAEFLVTAACKAIDDFSFLSQCSTEIRPDHPNFSAPERHQESICRPSQWFCAFGTAKLLSAAHNESQPLLSRAGSCFWNPAAVVRAWVKD